MSGTAVQLVAHFEQQFCVVVLLRLGSLAGYQFKSQFFIKFAVRIITDKAFPVHVAVVGITAAKKQFERCFEVFTTAFAQLFKNGTVFPC